MIEEILNENGIDTEVKDVADTPVTELSGEHDLILMGCPAYGDEEIELQEDFVDFYEKMNGIALDGKSFAVFAPGDSSYEYFFGSVDVLEKMEKKLGGVIVEEGLKIDGDPHDSSSEIQEWITNLVKQI